MSWERFEGGTRTVDAPPAIGIQKKGDFAINYRAWQMMGEPAKLFLFFDKEADRIGFQPTRDDHPSAFTVRSNSGMGSTRSLAGQGFCKFYGCKPEAAIRAPLHQDGDGMFYVELAEARPYGKGAVGESQAGRLCARGERCVGYDPNANHSSPNKVRRDNTTGVCTACRQRAGL